MGEPAVKPLIAVLKNHEPGGREIAIETLGKIGDRRAVKPLLKTLADENPSVRKRAVEALGQIGDPRAVEPLLKILADKISSFRKTLQKAGERTRASWEEEMDFVADCENTIKALGKIGDPRAVEPLIDVLTDEITYLQEKAAQALAEIGDPRAVLPLIAALNKNSLAMREIAANALGKIGDARAIEALTAIVEAGPLAYYRERKQSAARISPPDEFGRFVSPDEFERFVHFHRATATLRIYQAAEKALEHIYAHTVPTDDGCDCRTPAKRKKIDN